MDQWTCKHCTLLNSLKDNSCALCGDPAPSLDDHVVDLTAEDEEDNGGGGKDYLEAGPAPWRPVYHFRSPQLSEISPHVNQRDHLCLADIITEEAEAVVLMNYLVDVPFLVNQCPALRSSTTSVLLLHGSKGNTEALNQARRDLGCWHWVVSEVSMGEERFGTHHSKIILAFYCTGVRVCIMTANLTETDLHYLTQGIFVQDFPFSQQLHGNLSTNDTKEEKDENEGGAEDAEAERFMFRTPLLQYLAHVKGAISHAAGILLNQRMGQLQRVDFSHCKVALIPAKPGRHQATQRDKWGALRLAAVLARHNTCSGDDDKEEKMEKRHALVMQCSSLGSMGKNEQFIDELAESMLVAPHNEKSATPVELVWPSVQCISQSYLGYNSGGSIPCNSDIIEELSPDGHSSRIKNGFARCLCKWDATKTGRHMFPPHMKCYFRYCQREEQSEAEAEAGAAVVWLQWFLLTSANLSQAAWGKQQRNGQVLYIKSYEMGVLFLPSWLERQRRRHGVRAAEKLFSCTPSHHVLGEYLHKDKDSTNITSGSRNMSRNRSSIHQYEERSSVAHQSKKRKFSAEATTDNLCVDIAISEQPCMMFLHPPTREPLTTTTAAPTSTHASTNSTSKSIQRPRRSTPTDQNVVPSAALREAPLPFSIPFAVPADKFSFKGTDYPWTWDKQRSAPDSNGNTWPP